MAFQKSVSSESNFQYFKYKECSKGQVLVTGHYVKTKEDNYGNTSYVVRKEDGGLAVLNSSGHLDYLMATDAKFGDFIRVTYDGSVKLEKGRFKGKDSHRFILEIDPDKKETVKEQVNQVTLDVPAIDDDDIQF